MKSELNLNEKALIQKFVDHLDAKEKERREQIRKQFRGPNDKEIKEQAKTQEAVDEQDQQSEPDFSHVTRGLRPMKKNMIKRKKNQASE